MAIHFPCPECHVVHTASDSVAGRRIRCPKCDAWVNVPRLASAAGEIPEKPGRHLEAGGGHPTQRKPADTVQMAPGETTGEETVVLEAVEVKPPMLVADQRLASGPATEGQISPVSPPVESPVAFASRRRDQAEMDMTPMVDVVFQLLIFFMLTAAFALQKSLAVPKSPADQPSENVVEKPIDESPEYVTVRVDEFNTYHVLTVDWEQEAPSIQDLHIQLRRARDGSANGVVPTKLRVEAHGDALHGRVVAALDAGTATGFEEVQLPNMESDD